MRSFTVAGFMILVVGFILLTPFFMTSVNPNVGLADGALLVMALGALIIASAIPARITKEGGRNALSIWAGWCVFSTGLMSALAGLLLWNQVECSCPSGVACSCGGVPYGLMSIGGIIVSLVGIIIMVAGVMRHRALLMVSP